jgi:hypothetical protein
MYWSQNVLYMLQHELVTCLASAANANVSASLSIHVKQECQVIVEIMGAICRRLDSVQGTHTVQPEGRAHHKQAAMQHERRASDKHLQQCFNTSPRHWNGTAGCNASYSRLAWFLACDSRLESRREDVVKFRTPPMHSKMRHWQTLETQSIGTGSYSTWLVIKFSVASSYIGHATRCLLYI